MYTYWEYWTGVYMYIYSHRLCIFILNMYTHWTWCIHWEYSTAVLYTYWVCCQHNENTMRTQWEHTLGQLQSLIHTEYIVPWTICIQDISYWEYWEHMNMYTMCIHTYTMCMHMEQSPWTLHVYILRTHEYVYILRIPLDYMYTYWGCIISAYGIRPCARVHRRKSFSYI